jgi:hypothetical protein
VLNIAHCRGNEEGKLLDDAVDHLSAIANRVAPDDEKRNLRGQGNAENVLVQAEMK